MKNSIQDKLHRPLHDVRISVIDRCNFRCPYCMPSNLDYKFLEKKDWLTFTDIERLVKLFVQLGAVKIRLTGGEPLLRPNLPDLIKKLSHIPEIEDLCLTTNGSHLIEHAKDLKKAGLKRLTVSLDTMDSRIFKVMSGEKGSLKKVLDGIKSAEKAGFDSMKINVVVQKGVNDQTILDIVKYFKNTKHSIRFIEYMDVGNCNHWQEEYVLPTEKIVAMINKFSPIETIEKSYFGEVATRYRFKDNSGEIGFVSSVSQPFCHSCTRLRLSTDGKLYTCLFSNEGTDIKTPLRLGASDTELLKLIHSTWERRQDRYSETRKEKLLTTKTPQKIEMFQIGG